MADVLFAHSYFLAFDPKEYRAMMPYPPLGTLYAASYARSRGYTVALFDSMLAADEREIIAALRQHTPRVLVIYDDDFNYLTKMCLTRMREAAFRLTDFARQAGCTVVVHGSDPVDHIDDYLRHGAGYVLCGEGEITLGETLDMIFRGAPERRRIAGLAYSEGGTTVRNAPRDVLRDLDTLPFPAWDLVDVERYRSIWVKRHGYFSVNMVTTRGCPFHCNWCAKPLYGQVYHARSPKNVVEELVWLRETVRPDHIWFCDDIFGLKPGWISDFADEVHARNAVTRFKCLARVDLLLRDSAAGPLRRAGCETVWVGAESGSQAILDAMDKGTTVEQIRNATRQLKEAGIRVGFFLQYGYPGETLTDIEATLFMLRTCMPEEIGISVSYPLPGTRFYESVLAKLGEKKNWVDSQDLALMYPGEYPPDFYRALHTFTHKRYRTWQARALFASTIRRPATLTRASIRTLLAGVYHAATMPRSALRMRSLASSTSPR